MNPAIIQADAAERTREMHAHAAKRRRAAEIRRSRRSQAAAKPQRSRRGFRVRHALRMA